MSKDWNYKPGEWNLICDVCGKKMKSSSARHRWDGLIVCDEDFEHRHAQDFLRVPSDKTTVPFMRPRPSDLFVSISYNSSTYTCIPSSVFATAGDAVAGCVIAGKINPGFLN